MYKYLNYLQTHRLATHIDQFVTIPLPPPPCNMLLNYSNLKP